MRRRGGLCCYFLVCILVTFAQASFGQKRVDEMLNRRLEPLETQADTLHLMLSKISTDYGVPIGLEMATEGEDPIISVVIQDRRLRDVLDDIVKQDSRYEWRVVDDVINVRPKSRRDPLLEGILEARIETFAIPKGTRLFRVRNELVEIPEVMTLLRKAKVEANPMAAFSFGGDAVKLGQDFSLSVSNVTVREILNQIIRASDFKYWVVNRSGKKKEFFALNF